MKFLPYIRLFLAADAGGAVSGAADVSALPVDDGAGTNTPSADTVLAELTSFDAPNLNVLLGNEASDPVEKLPRVEMKGDEQRSSDLKPGGAKAGDRKHPVEPPARQLREELERTRKERDEIRSKLENHPRVRELEGTISEREKELERLKSEVENTRKALEVRDPLASGKLREHQRRFDEEFNRSIELVPEIDGRYQQLVAEFARLPRHERGEYASALAKFEAKVEDAVGYRKFSAAMDIIRKGYDFIAEHQQLRRDVTENAGRLAFEARESEWRKHDGEVSALLASALDVPEDVESGDPYHPALFLSRALGQVDEAKRKEVMSTIDTFVRRVFAGQKPRSANEFPGLSPQEIQERVESEAKWHAESRQSAVRMMKQGMLALTMLRPVVSELARLRERAKREGESTPPGPNNGGEAKSGDYSDLANYQAPRISI